MAEDVWCITDKYYCAGVSETVTPQQQIAEDCRQFYHKACELFKRKNRDYNKPEDPLSGFRKRGVMGILVRLDDKFGRIDNLLSNTNEPAVDESIEDTLIDICNYCFLLHAMLEDRKKRG